MHFSEINLKIKLFFTTISKLIKKKSVLSNAWERKVTQFGHTLLVSRLNPSLPEQTA